MRQNPYSKYLGPEDHLQHQVITWLKWQYPKLKYHHSPNEGKRSAFEQFKFKYLGSDAGFPDLIFPEIKLVIELKIKPNTLSKAQKEWLDYFESIGWTAKVCYTFEEANTAINNQISIYQVINSVGQLNDFEKKVSDNIKSLIK